MARSIKMPFVPSTLKKVREISGCTEDEAAKRVRKDAETIRRWESDTRDELPTLAQAKNLAKWYRYSAGVFLLEELPGFIRVPDTHDFRTLAQGERMDRGSWSRNLRYLIRQMEARQEFAVDAIRRAESSYQRWVGSVTRDETTPEDLAVRIRELLGVECDSPYAVAEIENVLKEWIRRFEQRAGIFVFQTDNNNMPIEVDEMRGLSMADQHAPFIVLNSKDSHAGRIFTLFHEFAHLWLGTSGISASDGIEFRGTLSVDQLIERYCNRVAGNALMPADMFRQTWDSASPKTDLERIEFASGIFGVSRLAAAVRAQDLRLISRETFSRFTEQFKSNEGNVRSSTSGGGGGNNYATLNRNAGAKFIGLVLGEYYSDEISIKETAALLDMRMPSVFSLAEYVGFKP